MKREDDSLAEILARGKKVSRTQKTSLALGQFSIGNVGSVIGLYLFVYYI